MKRKLIHPTLKKTALAVPAAALMLGAAQAGTTIGLNFQAWYYANGGAGYQTTGFPVTGKAFGVEVADWLSTVPQDCQSPINDQTNVGSITISWTAPNAWQSGIGELNTGWVAEAVAPGNNEVTWGYLDDGNKTGSSPSATITGLAAKFPAGYVVQTIAANSGVKTYDPVELSDGVKTNLVTYSTYYVTNPASDSSVTGGTVGLSTDSGLWTSDTLQINCIPKTSSNRSVLAGFIVTDRPVVSRGPVGGNVNQGATLSLSATAIGVPPLWYQWRFNGAAISNATNSAFTLTGIGGGNAGDYDVVVTNAQGAGTSVVASVTVIASPSVVQDLTGVTGTVYSGANFSLWSVVAAGGQPLQYDWLKNGTTAVGLNNPTLILTNVASSDSGNYSVLITNAYGSAHSATNHLVVVASPNLYTTTVAKDSPEGYWPLNETSGTNALDYSGSAHEGTNNSGVTPGAVGPRPPSYAGFDSGKIAYQFDGSSGSVELGTGPSIAGTNDFTVEAWINTSSSAAARIIQQRDAAGYNGEYMFSVNADGTLNFTLYGNGYQFNFNTASKVNDGKWHHVAAVRSGGTTGLIYIDGTVAGSQTTAPVAPLDATITTAIGADVRDSNNYFNGQISDVAIYAQALSAAQIGNHAYVGSLGNAPVSLKLVPGGYIADTKPSGTPLPGVNRGASWVASVTDAAASPLTRTGVEVFSGASQIATPAAPDLNSSSGTIMFWVQANAPIPGPGSEGAMLFDRRTTNGTVIVLGNDGGIFWQGQAGSQNSVSTGYVPDNNWHHVAVTYGQTTNDFITIYIDGVLSGAPSPITNAWSWPVDQEMEIGASHDSYWKKLNGQMDDFRMYSRVLSAPEINQVFTSGAIVDSAAMVLRYNFDTSGAGQSLSWSVGPLQSSPTLGPTAVWTTIPNAAPPYPFMPPAPGSPSAPVLFYRVAF